MPPGCTPARRLCVAVRPFPTTILPWGERPTGRLPRGLCRYNARRVEAYNDRSFDSNIDSNIDANDDGFNFRNDVASNAWYSDGLRLRFWLRFSAGFGHQRSCRRSSLHSARYFGRYFLTNNDRYFVRPNLASGAKYQFPGVSYRFGRLGTRSESSDDSAMSPPLVCF